MPRVRVCVRALALLGAYGQDDIILSYVMEQGPKWVEIAARLPGRTEHAARNRYHRLASRSAKGLPVHTEMDI